MRLYRCGEPPSLLRMPEPTAPPQEFSVASTPYGLQGKLLVATPHIGDPLFEKSVIYMCLHGEDGAMGVVDATAIAPPPKCWRTSPSTLT